MSARRCAHCGHLHRSEGQGAKLVVQPRCHVFSCECASYAPHRAPHTGGMAASKADRLARITRLGGKVPTITLDRRRRRPFRPGTPNRTPSKAPNRRARKLALVSARRNRRAA